MVVRKVRKVHFFVAIFFLVIVLPMSANAKRMKTDKTKVTAGTIKGRVMNRWAKLARYPTLVYIEKIKGGKYKAPENAVTMNQLGTKFVPRLLPVLRGTEVNFLNGDNQSHDVYSTDTDKYSFDEFAPGEQRSYTFKRLGPYIQLCRTHHKMKAYMLVLQNPFYTFTDDKGRFTLQDVPQGNWKVKVFNERMRRDDTDKTFDITVTAGFRSTLTARW